MAEAHASAAAEIKARLKEQGDWRAETLGRLRSVILEADPDVVEEIKWRKPGNPAGVPTYSHDGLICMAETYKDKVKFTFAKGASLDDPTGILNMGAGIRRAVDIRKGETIDEEAFAALFLSAVALNSS